MKIARFCEESGACQSVKEHLENVGLYCARVGAKIGLADTACLMGILHDMGKLSEDFQDYIKSQKNKGGRDAVAPRVDHGVYGAKYVYNRYKNKGSLQRLTSQIIAFVICYHHGGLRDCLEKNEIPFLKRMDKLDEACLSKVSREFEDFYPAPGFIEDLFKKACSEIKSFYEAFSRENTDYESFSFETHLLIKTLYSILIDSDWYDSYLANPGAPSEEQIALWESLDIYISNLKMEMDRLGAVKPDGEKQKTVFKKREQIAKDCLDFAANKTGVYTLTVPTGGGKTLSSFGFALGHAKRHKKERVFYVAPYTSIIEQNAATIRRALGCENHLLEFHSNVVSGENESSMHFGSRWGEHFIFTTMVQFLNTFYAAPSQNIRRLQSFINSVIIFDEVQSVPVHCVSLFNSAVNFLNKYLNCTIILCTATQPVLNEVPRPVKLSKGAEITGDIRDAFEKLKRVNVVDATVKGGYSCERVVEFLRDISRACPSVLLIVNTVSAAERIFNLAERSALSAGLFYLSSNLCPCHRKEIIEDIKKGLAEKQPLICISTQVMECGVDISFGAVVRSVAGVDSIAQAAGRCNRHGEDASANTYIINLDECVENTQRILSIDIGKKKAAAILDLYRKDPGRYDNSLLSTKAVYEYFMRFINEEKVKEQFDYPLPGRGASVYGLLSCEASVISAYAAFAGEEFPLGFCFQFETARKNFSVIENNTKTVIVPFKGGREIIADLKSSLDFKKKAAALKKAQNYLVNIYENKFKQLERLGAIVLCDIEGVYLLGEGFYSESTGVDLEGNMDFLNS